MARRSITFDRGTECTDWPTCRPALAHRHGFATRNRPGRKARFRTPIAAPEDGFRERLIRSPSATANYAVSATSSTRYPQMPRLQNPRRSLPAKDHGEDAINALACRCSKVALQRELTRPAICPPVRSARARLRRRGAIGQFGQSDQHVDEQILGFTIIRIVVRAQVEIRTLHRYAAHATRRKVSTVHGEVRSFPPRSDRRRP